MEAVVLTGGLGTRMREISDTQKTLLPIAEKPFLCHVLDYLKAEGILRVILAVGHHGESVERAIGSSYFGMEVVYSFEPEPLGTGGAFKAACQLVQGNEFFGLNGDSLFRVSLQDLQTHSEGFDVGISLRKVDDVVRYGQVAFESDTGKVTGFSEKSGEGPGHINGGIYFFKREVFDRVSEGASSIEKVWFPKWVKEGRVCGVPCDAYFIDMGVPKDYERACEERTLGLS